MRFSEDGFVSTMNLNKFSGRNIERGEFKLYEACNYFAAGRAPAADES